MASDKTRFYVRRFLNRPHHYEGAYVILRVEDTSEATLDRRWSDITCVLADCNRKIDISFDLDSVESRRNSLHKAKVLADSFREFYEALAEEAEVVADRERRFNAMKRTMIKQGVDESEVIRRIRRSGV